jgi:hypothetical protein
MKCLLFVLYLASLFAKVYSLGLNIATLVGNTAVVQWTREAIDPNPLTFDLRFVIPPYDDVGLAKANVCASPAESSGNITVQFPGAGRYMLIAVSGSRNNVQIGRTIELQVPGNTTVPTPSQTPTPSPTPTPSQTPIPSIPPSPSKSLTATDGSACPNKKINVPALVFAVLGGVSLTGVLIFAVFYLRRRRPVENKRISFYRERMVQQRSSDEPNPSVGRVGGQGGAVIPYPFTDTRASFGSTSQSSRETRPHDIEQGLAVPPPALTFLPRNLSGSRPSTPLTPGYTVPPPRGPRDRAKSVRRIESTKVTRVNGEPTSRQRQLTDKLVNVEKQIKELRSLQQLGPSTIVLLEDLEMQKAWLVKQRDSMWALEEIDTLPPGYSRYMT